jgi:hypothetical protein
MAVLPGTYNICRFSHEIHNFNDRLILLQRSFNIKPPAIGALSGLAAGEGNGSHRSELSARKAVRTTLELRFATKTKNEPPEAHHQRQAHGRR